MQSKNTLIRPIRGQDLIDLLGRRYPYSIRGYAAEQDGVVVGVGGIMYSQPLQCFSLITDEMKKDKRAVVKAVRFMRELLNSYSAPVYAIASEDEPTAPGFLKHIGFEQIDEEFYEWPIQQQ